MICKLIIAILFLIILILICIIISYRRQINYICRQLQFRLELDSNLLVQTDSSFRSTQRLAKIINEFLADRRKERIKAAKKEKSISDIYTNLSHDIRTPLTSLDGYVQLLYDSRNEDERMRYLAIISERIKCIKEMLDELFTFARLKNDDWQLEMTECCLNKITSETLFSYYDVWKKKGIEPHVTLPDNNLYFYGNEAAYRRVLQNIIKNALIHGEKELKVILYEADDNIFLEIGNCVPDGISMDVESIFQRFYKADEARNRNSTGLGLAIAKEFVERMNGKISAEYEDGWFYIRIVFNALNS